MAEAAPEFVYTLYIAAPVDRVWNALVDGDLLGGDVSGVAPRCAAWKHRGVEHQRGDATALELDGAREADDATADDGGGGHGLLGVTHCG